MSDDKNLDPHMADREQVKKAIGALGGDLDRREGRRFHVPHVSLPGWLAMAAKLVAIFVIVGPVLWTLIYASINPPGTILMLDTGEIALAFQPNARNPYRPRVLLLTAKDGSFYSQPTPTCLTDQDGDQGTYKRTILTTMSLEDTNVNPFKILKSYAPQQAEP